jgi:hypothetical protein
MIPFVKQIVPEVDTQLRQIEVDPPEGLLDMATVQPLKRVGGCGWACRGVSVWARSGYMHADGWDGGE